MSNRVTILSAIFTILITVSGSLHCCKDETTGADDFNGIWYTNDARCPRDGVKGTESVQIVHNQDSIIATKITSVGCVTVGTVSFRAANRKLDDAYYDIIWTIGSMANPDCCTSPGRIYPQSKNEFVAIFLSDSLHYLSK